MSTRSVGRFAKRYTEAEWLPPGAVVVSVGEVEYFTSDRMKDDDQYYYVKNDNGDLHILPKTLYRLCLPNYLSKKGT